MPAYEPTYLRDSLLRSAANSGLDNSSVQNRARPIEEQVTLRDGKRLYNGKTLEEWRQEQKARNEFRKASPEYRLAQEKLGLDPNRDLELLRRDDKSLLSNLQAGAEDVLLGLSEMGSYLASKVPSPRSQEFASQKDIISDRRKLLKRFMENDDERNLTPGGAVSGAAGLLNPAGKAKWLNAAYHFLRGASEDDSLKGGVMAGGSNLAGEAIEDSAVNRALSNPKVAALAAKVPSLKRLSGLPGNVAGATIESVMDALASALESPDEPKKSAAKKEAKREASSSGNRNW